MNPIVIKEARQAVRSKFVTGVLLLFLLVLIGVSALFMITTMANIDRLAGYGVEFDIGREFFSILTIVLGVAGVLFVPAYVGLRLSSERWSVNMDLLYTTTITPAAIIRGKLFAGMIILFLLYSAAMPFITFTYLLRGIDLFAIFSLLAVTYVEIVVLIQGVILIALIPAGRFGRILIAIATLPVLGFVFSLIVSMAIEFMQSGIGSRMLTAAFWGESLVVMALVGSLFWILHIISIALASPRATNRALLLRGWITVLWMAWGIAIVIIAQFRSFYGDDMMQAWMIASVEVLSIALLVVISESDNLSGRVRRTIPGGIKRIAAFLFYNGAAGGVLWAMALGLLTILFTSYIAKNTDNCFFVLALLLYVYGYVMTAHALWRILLKKYIRQTLIWLVAVILAICGSLLPIVAEIVWRETLSSDYGLWKVFNLLALMRDFAHNYPQVMHLYAASIWALVITLLHARWFARQFSAFRPVAPAAVIEIHSE